MYATIATVRATERLQNETSFPDADVTEALEFAKGQIDRYTGSTFGNIETPAYDPFDVEVRREMNACLRLVDDDGFSVVFPRTIDTATRQDTAEALDVSAWTWSRTGVVDGAHPPYGVWLRITGTAGRMDRPNADIEWCAAVIARNHLLNDFSKIPDRAKQVPGGEFGPINLAMPSDGSTTGFPKVDERLRRYRYRAGGVS